MLQIQELMWPYVFDSFGGVRQLIRSFQEKSVTESDLTDMRRKLRSVKSAESLTSGHSEPASNELDILGPLCSLNKPSGHNRFIQFFFFV